MRKGWIVKRLKDVCEKITDGTHQTPNYFEKGVIFLSSKNVKSQKIDWDNVKYIDKKQHLEMHKRIAPRLNDILLAKNGTTGVAALVDRDVIFDIYVSLAFLRPLPIVFPLYLLNFINSPIAKKQFNKRLKGAGVPNLHLQEIREVQLPIPPLPEQKRIVKILDEIFTAIDKAKANAEKNLSNSKELFKSYLNGVFCNRGKDWEEKKLGEVTTKIGSGATPRGGNASYKEEGISLVRSMNVHDFYFREKKLAFIDKAQADALSNVTVQENDVLLNITGASIARCCVIPNKYLPARVNQHVSIIRAKDDIVSPFFLNLLLTSKFYKDQLLFTGEQGATRQAVTKAQLEAFKISIPKSLTKQKVIANKLDMLSAETKKMEFIYHQKIDALEELKKSILKKAFKGEL
ncbi:MAG: restriction endonuclease subunit S [Candidatus Aureabacteria bacterium]|nr:restriction endonuclease subunit S [Candidatus Auribacterota bacterium]